MFFFWKQVFCSFNAPDELMLFVAAFIFGTFIWKANIEIHLAWNCINSYFGPGSFNKLHAIAAKYGLHNLEANWVLSASLASSFHAGLMLITFWPKT